MTSQGAQQCNAAKIKFGQVLLLEQVASHVQALERAVRKARYMYPPTIGMRLFAGPPDSRLVELIRVGLP